MTNFIKEMNRVGVAYELKETGTRVFNRLKTLSGYEISIQCSKIHYCEPRQTLDDLNCYSAFELAIFRFDNFTCIKESSGFSRFNELYDCYDGTVFHCVPKDLVEDLYDFLNS